ncbi:MAG: hypothetical protein HOE90_04130 [Bacteriovoracaceae bacterium]|jgi:hypothetical protein|nr:hypothetical protein [Bacteriovoracaceae bacterium]
MKKTIAITLLSTILSSQVYSKMLVIKSDNLDMNTIELNREHGQCNSDSSTVKKYQYQLKFKLNAGTEVFNYQCESNLSSESYILERLYDVLDKEKKEECVVEQTCSDGICQNSNGVRPIINTLLITLDDENKIIDRSFRTSVGQCRYE